MKQAGHLKNILKPVIRIEYHFRFIAPYRIFSPFNAFCMVLPGRSGFIRITPLPPRMSSKLTTLISISPHSAMPLAVVENVFPDD